MMCSTRISVVLKNVEPVEEVDVVVVLEALKVVAQVLFEMPVTTVSTRTHLASFRYVCETFNSYVCV